MLNRLEKLQAVKAWFNDHRSELQTQPAMVDALRKNRTMENYVRDIYFALYNKPLSGCSSCLADALLEVIFSEDRMKEIVSCRFKLKSGVLLRDSSNKLPMATVANLTDEIAIAYLRDNIARKKLFALLPENLDELLKGEKPAPEPANEPDNGQGAEKGNADAPEQGAETGTQGEQTKEAEQSTGSEEKAPENGENGKEEETITAEQVKEMTYNELKAEAAKRGLKPAGTKKADLLDALLASI